MAQLLNTPMEGSRLRALASHLFLLAMTATLAAVLTAAMVMQYAFGEIPCPLCLLQRVMMFGICFGLLLNLRGTPSDRNLGLSLLFSVLLLIVSVRQTLLDIAPRPGHEYVGSAVLGLHMPVWSVVISLCLLIAFALYFILFGGSSRDHDASTFPWLCRAATIIGGYIVAICAINFVSVILQCGLGQCHTMGYALL